MTDGETFRETHMNIFHSVATRTRPWLTPASCLPAGFPRTIACIAVLVAALVTPGAAIANCSRPIVVPASSLGKMLVVDEATGTISGIYPDILRSKGQKIGCIFEFPIVSRARAELMFRNGDADLLVGATQQAEREL